MECIWISRTGNITTEQLRLTDATLLVTDGTQSFAPAPWTRSDLPSPSATAAANVSIRMPLADWDIGWDPELDFRVTVYRCSDVAVGVEEIEATLTRLFVAEVVGFTREASAVVLQCSLMARRLQDLVGTQSYQHGCRWDLFGAGCGLDRDDYTETGTISAVVDDVTLESAAFGGLDAGYLTGGVLTIGEHSRLIVSHDEPNDRVTIVAPFPELPEVTDVVEAWPGCPKSTAACADKFSNIENYGGITNVPTTNPSNGVFAGVS